MKRRLAALIVLGLAAACDRGAAPKSANPASSPEGQPEQLLASNATVVG
jgi:hypothetical protein